MRVVKREMLLKGRCIENQKLLVFEGRSSINLQVKANKGF